MSIARVTMNYSPSQYAAGRALQVVEKELGKVGTAVAGTIGSGVGLALEAVVDTARAGVAMIGTIIDCRV